MNISYNGNYIFNVDMIEFVREDMRTGFDGIVLHKGNKQVQVNLKHHIEKYVKNFIKTKKIKAVSDDEFKEKINNMIYMFMIGFDDIIEGILYNNDNKVLCLDNEIFEYVSENIQKYFGGENAE